MFCTKCGQQLAEGASFCTRCGNRIAPIPPAVPAQHNQPVQPSQPAQPAPAYQQPQAPAYQTPPQPAPNYQQPTAYQAPASSGDTVVWVFSATRKFSMFKQISCNIIFMQDKLVLAHLSKELQKAESDRVSQEIKASGKGFFKGSAAMMSHWSNFHRRYYDLPIQQILAESPDNVVIPYSAISQVLFHAFSEHYSSDDSSSTQTSGGKFNLALASGETIKFGHSQGNSAEIKETLTRLFGPRLKYKR